MVSSYGSYQYKTFKLITRDRLLHEMLRCTKSSDMNSTWKVLVVDKFTTKIMSSMFNMTETTEEGVSLFEDISLRRQPFSFMDAIYFIQPSTENITTLLSDMGGKSPLYRKAFVFFSSPVPRELIHIMKDPYMLHRTKLMREMNLEYLPIDSQGFITGNERTFEDLFADDERTIRREACLNQMATRIATVFASLREFPFVRYRAAKSLDAAIMTTYPDIIPTKLAAYVWHYLDKYKATISDFPQTETCELLILDRSVDQVAPVIHEWFYDAMCHDFLHLEGNKYVHEVPNKTGGSPEMKESFLDEHDPVWLELRHAHIAEASERLQEKLTSLTQKNSTAKILCSRAGAELSTRDMCEMARVLPQYSEQIDKLSLHVEITGKIHSFIQQQGLREIGQLEEDLVFGYAGMEDVVKLMRRDNLTQGNKLRLLMILSAIYPEKLEGEKGLKLMQLANLTAEDMIAVQNMRLLGASLDTQKSSNRTFSLKFGMHKRKTSGRKERTDSEETWNFSRFYPMMEELVEKLCKGELSKDDYPCANDSNVTSCGSSLTPVNRSSPHLVRSRRTATWARRHNSGNGGNGCSSDSILGRARPSNFKMGKRIFVFIIGGATRSELRACHKLTKKLQREIVLGSSSLDDPQQFIMKLKKLSTDDELSLDDIEI